MIFFISLKRYLTLLFLSFYSLGLSNNIFSITVFDDNYRKNSNISVVPVDYNVDYVYNSSIMYGEKRVISKGVLGYKLFDSDKLIIPPVNEIVEVGTGYKSIYYGSTTGYGSNCVGCSGNVACSTSNGTHNLVSDGIYYNDSKYGNVRIVAADNSVFSCGTIMEIDNGNIDPFMAIVLDTGGAMRDEWSRGNILVDIAFNYESSEGINNATNRNGNVKFKIYRSGW